MPDGGSYFLISQCSSPEEFVAAFRRYADRESLFVPTGEPLAVGQRTRVAVTLADGSVMIEGDGEIVSASTGASGLHGRAGMTVRFAEIDGHGREMLMLLSRARAMSRPVPLPTHLRPKPLPSTVSAAAIAEARARPTRPSTPGPGADAAAAKAACAVMVEPGTADTASRADSSGVLAAPAASSPGKDRGKPSAPPAARSSGPRSPSPDSGWDDEPAPQPMPARDSASVRLPGIAPVSPVKPEERARQGGAPPRPARSTGSGPLSASPPPSTPAAGGPPRRAVPTGSPPRPVADRAPPKSSDGSTRRPAPPSVSPPPPTPSSRDDSGLLRVSDLPTPSSRDDSGLLRVSDLPTPSSRDDSGLLRASDFPTPSSRDDSGLLRASDFPTPSSRDDSGLLRASDFPTPSSRDDSGLLRVGDLDAPTSRGGSGLLRVGDLPAPSVPVGDDEATVQQPWRAREAPSVDSSRITFPDSRRAVEVPPAPAEPMMTGDTASEAAFVGAAPEPWAAPPLEVPSPAPELPPATPPRPRSPSVGRKPPSQIALQRRAPRIGKDTAEDNMIATWLLDGEEAAAAETAAAERTAAADWWTPIPQPGTGALRPGAGAAAIPIGRPAPGLPSGPRSAGGLVGSVPDEVTRGDSTDKVSLPGRGIPRSVKYLASAAGTLVLGAIVAFAVSGRRDEPTGPRPLPEKVQAAEPATPGSTDSPATPRSTDSPATPPPKAAIAPAAKAGGDDSADTEKAPARPAAAAKPATTDKAARPAGSGPCRAQFSSAPPGAEVVVGGRVAGVTPLDLALPCRAATATFRRERYEPVQKRFTPKASGVKVAARLERPFYAVKLTSSPAGATVTMAGKKLGKTPVVAKVPGYERVTVTFAKAGFATAAEKVYAKKSGAVVNVALKKAGKRR